jgi:predicted nucleotidyltransferase
VLQLMGSAALAHPAFSSLVPMSNDPTLTRFRDAVRGAYGARVERVVLFGSRARGDARPDSDYDVAVFLHDMPDGAQEMNRLADIATDVLYDVGGVVHAMPYPAGSYRDRTPLMHEIRTDGIDL